MSTPTFVSDPSVLFLHQVLDEIAKAFIQIPAFQRKFVWSNDQRLELLESIREGIPIGSILVWRTTKTELRCVWTIGPHTLPEQPKDPPPARSYLLDGLQRMSTLYGCLHPLPKAASPYTTGEDGAEVSWRVGYDLENEEFVVLERGESPSKSWLPLSTLMDSVGLLRFQRSLATDELVDRADALAETFRTYKLPVIPVVTDDLAGATRTFERINRQGTPMTELQMVRALTYKQDFDLSERLLTAREQLAEVGWGDIDDEVILRTTKAALDLDIAIATPDDLAEHLAKNPTVLDLAAGSLVRTARWLRDACDIPSYRVVPYLIQTVLLADALRSAPNLTDNGSRQLSRWLWHTTYTGEFRGLSGGRLQKQLRRVRELAKGAVFERAAEKSSPDFALPDRFAPRQVRVVAAGLQLARLDPKGADGMSCGAAEQLSSQGVSAMVPILRGRDVTGALRGIANRIYAREASDPRGQLLLDATKLPDDVLRSHAITAEAAAALCDRNWARFGELRAAEIERQEREFFENLWV
jgi:hypothetical protein